MPILPSTITTLPAPTNITVTTAVINGAPETGIGWDPVPQAHVYYIQITSTNNPNLDKYHITTREFISFYGKDLNDILNITVFAVSKYGDPGNIGVLIDYDNRNIPSSSIPNTSQHQPLTTLAGKQLYIPSTTPSQSLVQQARPATPNDFKIVQAINDEIEFEWDFDTSVCGWQLEIADLIVGMQHVNISYPNIPGKTILKMHHLLNLTKFGYKQSTLLHFGLYAINSAGVSSIASAISHFYVPPSITLIAPIAAKPPITAKPPNKYVAYNKTIPYNYEIDEFDLLPDA
jgi:hypothetical protein